MEENKYVCPKCGAEMIAVYEKPALNLTCPECGCQIASTKWEDIDLDDTDYEIIVKSVVSPSIVQIKLVSNLTGQNFIYSKKLLEKGGPLCRVRAVDMKGIMSSLGNCNIEYMILPEFPY